MFVKKGGKLGSGPATVLFPGLKAIADPGFGDDVARRGGVRLEFLAQLANEHAEIFHLLGALSSPDCA